MADGVGTWNVLEWTQVNTPKHGLESFLLEAEEVFVHKTGVVLLNTNEVGVLAVTNFRLLFVSRASKCIVELGTIPLTTIEKFTDDVKLSSVPRNSEKRELLQVMGKDMRVITFAFQPKTMQRSAVTDILKRCTKPSQLWEMYAFQCGPSKFKNSNPKSRLLKEYYRFFGKRLLQIPTDDSYVISNDRWRITTINSNYTLCPTYPSTLVVPNSISDEELLQAASFRTSRRIPVISWCNPGSGAVLARSSQPRVGLMTSRNHSDEKLVAGLCSSSASRRKLYIVDARPIANALANNVKGGGSESSSNYLQSEVVFLGIDNIHVMRESLSRLREYVDTHGTTSSDGISSFLRNGGSTWGGGNLSSMSGSASTLGDTGWLTHVQNVLSGAAWIAARIALESTSVLVHCSDGWDRTTQLVSLASLLLDPYYRTFKGFQALVEKDWLAFGHPFAERMGIPTVTDLTSSSSSTTEMMLTRQSSYGNHPSSSPLRSQSGTNLPSARSGGATHTQASDNFSPILLQWVDCISQLLRLYPCAFEFSSEFLVDFLDAVLSCRFGNFLCNCERERQHAGTSEVCGCIWVYLSDLRAIGGKSHKHFNVFYDPSRHEKPILPPAAVLAPTIWPQFHLRWACPSESHASELETIWRIMSKNYSEMSKAKDVAESKARDLKSRNDSLSSELQKEKHKSSSALSTANRIHRENRAIRRAVQSLGCKVNLSTNHQSHPPPSDLIDDPSDGSPHDFHDFSVSISAIEDAAAGGVVNGENPLSRVCESMCPFRTKDGGCKWPNEQCAQMGSQFIGLKADFDAFDRLSIYDRYFDAD